MSDEEWMRSPLRRLTPRARGQVESDEQRLIRETMHDVIRFSKRARTADAVEANRALGACQAARAILLSDQGLSAPVIGIRMALEDGRPVDKPYSERQVRKWLAAAKKG